MPWLSLADETDGHVFWERSNRPQVPAASMLPAFLSRRKRIKQVQ